MSMMWLLGMCIGRLEDRAGRMVEYATVPKFDYWKKKKVGGGIGQENKYLFPR